MPDAVLMLENVTRVHGSGAAAVHALDSVSLTVAAGELVAVMGPSGSGKSTLLNLCGALDSPTSGRVFIQGADVGRMRSQQLAELRRRTVGFVFQDFNLVRSLTAAENIGLPLELDGVSPSRARAAALGALEAAGLTEVADRFPGDMSGGQQQQVAVCRALIGGRRLILADEPTGSVDSATGEVIMRLLRRQIDEGAGGLLVTHESRQAAWADRIIQLRDGRIVTGPGAGSGT